MAGLYQIDERLRALVDWNVDVETGEIIEDDKTFNELFDEIQMDLQSKIENTILFAKELDAEAEAIKAEEKKLAERRKAKENLSERLKKRINDYVTWQFTDEEGNVDLNGLRKWKFDTSKVYISYRKSDVVEFTDATKIPKEFIKVETKETPMKAEIKKAIKEGKEVAGCVLVEKANMQIK